MVCEFNLDTRKFGDRKGVSLIKKTGALIIHKNQNFGIMLSKITISIEAKLNKADPREKTPKIKL